MARFISVMLDRLRGPRTVTCSMARFTMQPAFGFCNERVDSSAKKARRPIDPAAASRKNCAPALPARLPEDMGEG